MVSANSKGVRVLPPASENAVREQSGLDPFGISVGTMSCGALQNLESTSGSVGSASLATGVPLLGIVGLAHQLGARRSMGSQQGLIHEMQLMIWWAGSVFVLAILGTFAIFALDRWRRRKVRKIQSAEPGERRHRTWLFAARQEAERELRKAHETLASALVESERRVREGHILNEFSDNLQSCRTLQESYRFIAGAMEQLLPNESGAVLLTRASRDLLETAVTWGCSPETEFPFSPDDCWALRRGGAHIVDMRDSGLRCPHLRPSADSDSLCVPLVAHGEILGLVCIRHSANAVGDVSSSAVARENRVALASAVGKKISVAIANLHTYETLRNQSIRDALTGLFNRRYMEESLAREVYRASRRDHPIAVMMIDVDKFKQFNDTHGHEAGDQILRAFGGVLRTTVRGEDIACRYGGEEFTLILPDASLHAALRRADDVRAGAARLFIHRPGESRAAITISIGIAVFPEHGATAEELVRAADAALYRAKSSGRDRCVIAKSTPSVNRQSLAHA